MLKTMKLPTGIIVPVFAILFANASYSQAEIHSGYLQTEAATGATALKVHCDELTSDVISASVISDLKKYSGVLDVRCDVVAKKIIVKYTQPCNANLVLGVLESIYLNAYYLDNGNPVFYVKSGSEQFLR